MSVNKSDSLGFLLHDASRLLRRRFDARAQEYGLSSAQWRLLALLVIEEEGQQQARIAERLEIEPISVSRLVDRMEEAGWVVRQADPDDRRAKRVHATEKAIATISEIRGIAQGVFDGALQGLTRDERDLLMRGLRTVIANLGGSECMGVAASARQR